MWLSLDDLRCRQCGAFVHPLLDACPACCTASVSRRQDAADGPIGAVRLAEAPEIQAVARNISMRYTMKVNAIGKSGADATLEDAVAHLADALPYRIAGDAVQPTDNVALTLRDGSLLAQVRPAGTLVAEIPLYTILGAAARHGEVTLFYAASGASRASGAPAAGAPAAGEPASGAPAAGPGSTGPLRLIVANRRGLLASKARDDHFSSLAQWLGVLAAAAAERRWSEVGLPAYLAELGPAVGAAPGSAPGVGDDLAAQASGVSTSAVPTADTAWTPFGVYPAASASSSVQASLVELEGLRTAHLISEIEYGEKRREILARL